MVQLHHTWRATLRRYLITMAFAGVATVAMLDASPVNQPIEIEPLAIAFDFASAIHTDKIDQLKMQEKVVQDYITLGLLDLAQAKADKMNGWRQGTAYADIAVELAHRGRKDQARDLITKAEAVMKRTIGWQKPRIGAHIGRAEAALGNVEKSQQIGFSLPPSEGPKSLSASAASLAGSGDFDSAMKTLANVEKSTIFENQMAVVNGYLDIARHPALADKPDQRTQALQAAIRTSSKLPATRRVEVSTIVVAELIALKQEQEAQRLLDDIESGLSTDISPFYRAPAIAELSRSWMKLGQRERALKVLESATENWQAVAAIDEPETFAAIAAGFAAANDPVKCRGFRDKALASAEQLVNARPRAIAVVNTCRWMGRYGMELDQATRERLQKLRTGLKDPW